MTLTNVTPGAESEFSFSCFECEGTGKVSPETLKRMKREAAIWCSCDEPDFDGALFFDDGDHPEILKHHWRCPACDGVLQIG